ncbi:MAG: hypothetical protein DI629_20100 [Mesorhizobium amorphae]|nr:MAG: hypothetical protein DI629_20100 [Mesorhizobium amorphae]
MEKHRALAAMMDRFAREHWNDRVSPMSAKAASAPADEWVWRLDEEAIPLVLSRSDKELQESGAPAANRARPARRLRDGAVCGSA